MVRWPAALPADVAGPCPQTKERAAERLAEFMEKWTQHEHGSVFAAYFQKNWVGQLSSWAFAFRAEKLGISVKDIRTKGNDQATNNKARLSLFCSLHAVSA
jgi:hypothetical protein